MNSDLYAEDAQRKRVFYYLSLIFAVAVVISLAIDTQTLYNRSQSLPYCCTFASEKQCTNGFIPKLTKTDCNFARTTLYPLSILTCGLFAFFFPLMMLLSRCWPGADVRRFLPDDTGCMKVFRVTYWTIQTCTVLFIVYFSFYLVDLAIMGMLYAPFLLIPYIFLYGIHTGLSTYLHTRSPYTSRIEHLPITLTNPAVAAAMAAAAGGAFPENTLVRTPSFPGVKGPAISTQVSPSGGGPNASAVSAAAAAAVAATVHAPTTRIPTGSISNAPGAYINVYAPPTQSQAQQEYQPPPQSAANLAVPIPVPAAGRHRNPSAGSATGDRRSSSKAGTTPNAVGVEAERLLRGGIASDSAHVQGEGIAQEAVLRSMSYTGSARSISTSLSITDSNLGPVPSGDPETSIIF